MSAMDGSGYMGPWWMWLSLIGGLALIFWWLL
jgi:hypothetical protein